jgi:hypothetical protein
MKFKISDETPHMQQEKNLNHFLDLYGYIKKALNFKHDISELVLADDTENANQTLGSTAYYNPSDMTVCVYATGRHIKDLLRSFAHELIHHNQNCNDKINLETAFEDGYAQNDSHARELEKDAYLTGNLLFRDWEDEKKMKNKSMMSEAIKKALTSINEARDYEYASYQVQPTMNKVIAKVSAQKAGAFTKLGKALEKTQSTLAQLKEAKKEIEVLRKYWAGKEIEEKEGLKQEIINFFDDAESAMMLVVECAGSSYKLTQLVENSKDEVIIRRDGIIKTDYKKVVELLIEQNQDLVPVINQLIRDCSTIASEDVISKGDQRRLTVNLKEFKSLERGYEQSSLKGTLEKLKRNQININKLIGELRNGNLHMENKIKEAVGVKKYNAKIVRDGEEFVVRFFKNGSDQKVNYSTPDKDEAKYYAQIWNSGKGELTDDPMSPVQKRATMADMRGAAKSLQGTEFENDAGWPEKYSAKVARRPNEFGEWVVTFFENGKHMKNADYFATDKEEAEGTARLSLKQMNDKENSKPLQEVRMQVDAYQDLDLLKDRRKVVSEATIKALGLKFNMGALLEYKVPNEMEESLEEDSEVEEDINENNESTSSPRMQLSPEEINVLIDIQNWGGKTFDGYEIEAVRLLHAGEETDLDSVKNSLHKLISKTDGLTSRQIAIANRSVKSLLNKINQVT